MIVFLTGCSPEYQLSTSAVPNEGGSVSPSGGYFKGEVTIVATPAKNYKFNGWAGAASGNTNPLTVKMNSDKQIVAQFTKITYNLKIEPSLSGGTIQPNGGTFEAGTQVKVIATPASGYRFDHWGGSVTETVNTANIIMDSDKTITAYFTKICSLKISVPPGVGASVSPDNGVHDTGSVVTITAKATMFPYTFDHWSGTADDNVNPTTVTMDADKLVTLYFRELTAAPTVTDTQTIWGGGSVNVTIELNQFDWVQGEFWGPYFSVTLYDPNGKMLKNLGANFTFNAEIPGRYAIVLYNANTLVAAAYRLTYTVYH